MNDKIPFTIVGSGLAGALIACYLTKQGHPVDLYEKRSDPRRDTSEGGRSINLALSVRGIHALQQVGLAEAVLSKAIAMPGRMIHSLSGKCSFQPYGKNTGKAIYSVSRAGLNRTLIEAAAEHTTIHFDHRCSEVDLEQQTIRFETADGITSPISYQHLIGADGAFSAVRSQMQKGPFNYSQHFLTHGYKELTIPAQNGTHAIEPNALHIWPRERFMMIALPNQDGSFTCTLFAPFEGENSFATLQSEDAIHSFFQKQFADAVPLMPTLAEDFQSNPTGQLVTIRCQPWHIGGSAVLIGDACHAIVPFLGQGMNAAFEDCYCLAECLKEHRDTGAAFSGLEQRRKEHVDVLADLAIQNYYEMRDHVASPWFRLKKKSEIFLHKLLGNLYIPLYTLISFTRVPYADALRRAKKQNRIVLTLAIVLIIIVLFVLLKVFQWI